jgi:hypothetical protein
MRALLKKEEEKKEIVRYCTIVSPVQVEEARKSGDSRAKILVETHINTRGKKQEPFYKKLDTIEVEYSQLKF